MKKRLVDVIEMLDLDELVRMKRDIAKGAQNVEKIVDDRIKQQLKKHDYYCCVCNSKLDPISVSNFTLLFGPDDMKKRASFCAIDCMEYFLKNLKEFWEDENQAFIMNKKQSRK